MDFLLPVGYRRDLAGRFLHGELGRFPLLPLYDHNRHAALHLRALDEEEGDTPARRQALPMD